MMVNILKIVILNTSNAWHVPLIWQTWVSHREQHGDEKYRKRMTIVVFGCQPAKSILMLLLNLIVILIISCWLLCN